MRCNPHLVLVDVWPLRFLDSGAPSPLAPSACCGAFVSPKNVVLDSVPCAALNFFFYVYGATVATVAFLSLPPPPVAHYRSLVLRLSGTLALWLSHCCQQLSLYISLTIIGQRTARWITQFGLWSEAQVLRFCLHRASPRIASRRSSVTNVHGPLSFALSPDRLVSPHSPTSSLRRMLHTRRLAYVNSSRRRPLFPPPP